MSCAEHAILTKEDIMISDPIKGKKYRFTDGRIVTFTGIDHIGWFSWESPETDTRGSMSPKRWAELVEEVHAVPLGSGLQSSGVPNVHKGYPSAGPWGLPFTLPLSVRKRYN